MEATGSGESGQVEAIVEVKRPTGIHARISAAIARLVNRSSCQVWISREDDLIVENRVISSQSGRFCDEIDAGDVLGLLTLFAERGARLKISATGTGAPEILQRLVKFLLDEAEDESWDA